MNVLEIIKSLLVLLLVSTLDLVGQTDTTYHYEGDGNIEWNDFNGQVIDGLDYKGTMFSGVWGRFMRTDSFNVPILTEHYETFFNKLRSWELESNMDSIGLVFYQTIMLSEQLRAHRLNRQLPIALSNSTPNLSKGIKDSILLQEYINNERREHRIKTLYQNFGGDTLLFWKDSLEQVLDTTRNPNHFEYEKGQSILAFQKNFDRVVVNSNINEWVSSILMVRFKFGGYYKKWFFNTNISLGYTEAEEEFNHEKFNFYKGTNLFYFDFGFEATFDAFKSNKWVVAPSFNIQTQNLSSSNASYTEEGPFGGGIDLGLSIQHNLWYKPTTIYAGNEFFVSFNLGYSIMSSLIPDYNAQGFFIGGGIGRRLFDVNLTKYEYR